MGLLLCQLWRLLHGRLWRRHSRRTLLLWLVGAGLVAALLPQEPGLIFYTLDVEFVAATVSFLAYFVRVRGTGLCAASAAGARRALSRACLLAV